MTSHVELIAGHNVLVLQSPLKTERDASDLVGEALSGSASWVLLPVERLDPEFFRLASGLLGAVLQKLVNYRLRVAIVGDISAQVAQSKALADFVRESERGRTVAFVPDQATLERRIAAEG